MSADQRPWQPPLHTGPRPPHWQSRKLTPQDRDTIRREFAEALTESPGLTKSDFARMVCDRFGVRASTVYSTLP